MLDSQWTVHELAATPPGLGAGSPNPDGAATTVLVGVVVANPAPTPRRVRVTDRLPGPVLPPRRRGVPLPGWDEDGYRGTVPAGETLALGFASPGPVRDPPVVVEDRGRADAEQPREGASAGARSPDDVLRDLASPAPPRDAVPAPSFDAAAADAAVGAADSALDEAGGARGRSDTPDWRSAGRTGAAGRDVS